jgi:hypothetical protein
MKQRPIDIYMAGLIFIVTTLLFLTGDHADSRQINLEKILDAEILNSLTQGQKANVIVLLRGYKDYDGKVQTDEPVGFKTVQSAIRSQQESILQKLDPAHFQLRYRFENILGFSGTLTEEGLFALASMPEVEVIEKDDIREAHLKQGISLMNAVQARWNYNGQKVAIAIADTGIDYTHFVFGAGGFPNEKVIGGYDFADNDNDPMDCSGHGTAVAGIAAGAPDINPNNDYLGGVAFNAKLYALKISGGTWCNQTSDSIIVASWDWAVSHKNNNPNYPILIVNTSFGGDEYAAACDTSEPALAVAANNLVANGITLFTSSGNSGLKNSIVAPACLTNAISVGAVYDDDIGGRPWPFCSDPVTRADLVACYSNSAYFLDLLAPSHHAYTADLDGRFTDQPPGFGYTSAASAYAAGAGAILQSIAKELTGTYFSPDQIKAILVGSGEPITDPRNNIITPRVDFRRRTQPLWNICIKDVELAAEYWMNLEYGFLFRGQALTAFPDPAYPAPITGHYDSNSNIAAISVDYKNASGLRVYRINFTSGISETWAVTDDSYLYFDGPRLAELVSCQAGSVDFSLGVIGLKELLISNEK